MITINLLPFDPQKSRVLIRYYLLLYLLGLVIILSSIWLAKLVITNKSVKNAAQLQQLKIIVNQYEEQATQVHTLQQFQTQLRQRSRDYRRVIKQQEKIIRLLHYIATGLPQEVYLQQIDYQAGEWEIGGIVSEQGKILNWVQQLSANQVSAKVHELRQITTEQYEFEVAIDDGTTTVTQ